MKGKNDKYNGKDSVNCQPIDWDKYRIEKEAEDSKKAEAKKEKYEWDRPVVDERWTVDFKQKDTGSVKEAKNKKVTEQALNNKKEVDDLKKAQDKMPKAEDARVLPKDSQLPVNKDILKNELGISKTDYTVGSENRIPSDMSPERAFAVHIPTLKEVEEEKVRRLEQNIINSTLMQDDDLLINAAKEEHLSGEVKRNSLDSRIRDIKIDREDAAIKRLKELESLTPALDAMGVTKEASDKSDAELVSAKLAQVAERQIDKSEEMRLRKAANDKIIVQSSEVKKGKKPYSQEDKKKKRRRIPKAESNEMPLEKSVESKKESSKYLPLTEDNLKADKKEGGPSKFRRAAADWRDETVKKTQVSENIGTKDALKNLFDKFKSMSALSWAAIGMGVVIFITGVMTTAVYADYKGEQNKAQAIESLSRFIDSEQEEVLDDVQDIEIPIQAEEPEEEQLKVLSIVLSSVDKDLKIKLVDQDDILVKEVAWSVTITDNKGEEEVQEDDDRDGVIHIEGISAGDYSVALNPSDSLADYILPSGNQICSVKANIEYKVIANIKEEIKSEKEVNVAAEDPNGNQAADVETGTAPSDTVEWCESTKTANGDDSYVEAVVDLTKTASIIKDNPFLKALAGIRSVANSGTKKSLFAIRGLLVADNENQSPITGVEEPTPETPSEPPETPPETPTTAPEPPTDPTPTPTEAPTTVPDPPVDPTPTPTDAPTQAPTATPTPTTTPVVTATPTPTLKPTPTPLASKVLVTSIGISGSSSVKVGSTVNLKTVILPKNATNKDVNWSSSDESIATVYAGTVTGVKAGSVTITALAADGGGATATFTVTVTGQGEYADTAQLYDSNKNALYLLENGEYRLAKYIDYMTNPSQKFYKKNEGFLYTGWQTIDGNTYYYRSDHTYVTGTQVIQGVSYTFSDTGQLSQGSGTLGIDVSKYQPSINWSSVKASGISFVIIRCGYRGASTGVLIQDPYYTSHVKGAKAAGLKVGIYFFSTALTEIEAVEEASMCAALASGYGINYPVFLDVEPSSRAGYNGLPSSQRTANIKAFCSTVKSAGYTPGVYANKTWLTSYMNASELSGYKIWLAQYNANGPTYTGRYDLWQYTSKGSVSGISGNVDMNHSYLGY